MQKLRTISEIEKEFEEKFDKKMLNTKAEAPDVFCFRTGYNVRVAENWEENKEIKQFLTHSLRQLLEQVVPEEKEKSKEGKFPEVDEAMDFGFNTCRQQVEETIKKILK